MLQVVLAFCFSASPLTLYFPPCRQLSELVEKIQEIAGEMAIYYRRAYPQIRIACRRILTRCGLYRPRDRTTSILT
jgi:hypothetical protein|uniref:Secreted protein n=1 Tax=Picea sitchensis TaxID=3332 RepID=A9NQR1_PICSI|nr:unknown [Picea sitchensis]